MADTLSSLPDRPLTRRETRALEDAKPILTDYDTDEVRMVVFLTEKSVNGLGYEERKEEWVKFFSRDISFSEEKLDELHDEVHGWAKSRYAERIEEGDLILTGPHDPIPERGEEPETPWVVEQGLEPEYDCPDCGYYKTGLSSSPHTFLKHSQKTHGYTESEAWNILDA